MKIISLVLDQYVIFIPRLYTHGVTQFVNLCRFVVVVLTGLIVIAVVLLALTTIFFTVIVTLNR